MKLVGGDPCVDFVNTVGDRTGAGPTGESLVVADKLVSYRDVVLFAVHRGLVGENADRRLLRRAEARPADARRALLRTRAFREALFRLLTACAEGARPRPGDLEFLNAELRTFRESEALASDGKSLRWDWRPEKDDLGLPRGPVAQAAAALLTRRPLPVLRRCGGEDCGWLFVDTSRNGTRRWCTMDDCGNVAKARRFRRRQAGRRS
jgi:predicted RNA-binding Zn ribbon-like protein